MKTDLVEEISLRDLTWKLATRLESMCRKAPASILYRNGHNRKT